MFVGRRIRRRLNALLQPKLRLFSRAHWSILCLTWQTATFGFPPVIRAESAEMPGALFSLWSLLLLQAPKELKVGPSNLAQNNKLRRQTWWTLTLSRSLLSKSRSSLQEQLWSIVRKYSIYLRHVLYRTTRKIDSMTKTAIWKPHPYVQSWPFRHHKLLMFNHKTTEYIWWIGVFCNRFTRPVRV